MANTSVDGLVSGLSTTTIIEQLMSLERQPQLRLTRKRAANDERIAAYQAINTRLASLRSAADALTRASAWGARAVTSSSTAVTASATADALTGSVTFDVTSVARAQSYVYATAVASTAVKVADGDVTVTKGNGAPVTVAVGDGSLAGVISAINASNAGVRAAAVQTGTGLRLQLTSTTTGEASDFTVAGLTVGGVGVLGARNEVVAGSDAVLTVGPGSPGQYTITSPTNTVTPMPGLTLSVKQPAAGVTVDVARDDGAVADAVQKFVDALNSALSEISKATAYDPTTKKGSILLGDSTVRSLKQRLLSQVSAAVGGASAASAGIELQRDGTVRFNRETFLARLGADPDATARIFQAGAAVTDNRVSFVSVDDRTLENPADPYDVVVTRAATQASATLSINGVIDGTTTLNLVVGSRNVAVGVQPGDTAAQLADRINSASAAGGLGLVASLSGGDVVVRTAAYGVAPTFAMTAANGLSSTATTAGTDVAGTVEGLAAAGVGQMLTVTGEGAATGLVVKVTATAADVAGAGGTLALGSLTYTAGMAQRLDSVGHRAIDTVSGTITTAINGRRAENTTIDTQVEAWDLRLRLREAALRRQFTALESALGTMRSQSSWLSGQIAGLPSAGSS